MHTDTTGCAGQRLGRTNLVGTNQSSVGNFQWDKCRIRCAGSAKATPARALVLPEARGNSPVTGKAEVSVRERRRLARLVLELATLEEQRRPTSQTVTDQETEMGREPESVQLKQFPSTGNCLRSGQPGGALPDCNSQLSHLEGELQLLRRELSSLDSKMPPTAAPQLDVAATSKTAQDRIATQPISQRLRPNSIGQLDCDASLESGQTKTGADKSAESAEQCAPHSDLQQVQWLQLKRTENAMLSRHRQLLLFLSEQQTQLRGLTVQVDGMTKLLKPTASAANNNTVSTVPSRPVISGDSPSVTVPHARKMTLTEPAKRALDSPVRDHNVADHQCTSRTTPICLNYAPELEGDGSPSNNGTGLVVRKTRSTGIQVKQRYKRIRSTEQQTEWTDNGVAKDVNACNSTDSSVKHRCDAAREQGCTPPNVSTLPPTRVPRLTGTLIADQSVIQLIDLLNVDDHKAVPLSEDYRKSDGRQFNSPATLHRQQSCPGGFHSPSDSQLIEELFFLDDS